MKPILAIDPGTTESGVLVWDGNSVEYPTQVSNPDLLDWVRGLDEDWVMAVEMVGCYGQRVGHEVFETCLLIGRLQEIWITKQRQVELIYRREVKMHLCGLMKAKDADIRQALVDRFGKPAGVTSHLWSALAVAVTCAETKL